MNYELRDLLRLFGNRNTPARQLVFEALRDREAITIAELRAELADTVSTGAIYRTLQIFRDHKVIRDVVLNGVRKIELTEQFSRHHHHITCARCGEVQSIYDMTLEQQLKKVARTHNYRMVSHSFEITGVCLACQSFVALPPK